MDVKLNIDPILKCLPPKIARAVAACNVNEILLISDMPAVIYIGCDAFYISSLGEPTKLRSAAVLISKKELCSIFHTICDNSVYAVEQELKNGFITIEGGHRVGVCGSGVLRDGQVSYIKNISSLNIRIARQVIGKGKDILPYISDKYVHSTLIISPPGCGKTTILRDIARILGAKYKTGIADERGEIAAVYKGCAQHDIGEKSVVMDCVPKADAINMMIRSMGIEIVITDEIGGEKDAAAITNALYSGVKVLASAHGYSFDDVCRRPSMQKLISCGGFEKFIVLSRRFGPGTVEEVKIYDS